MTHADRAEFARRWAEEITGTSYVSMERDELVERLLAFTHDLSVAILAPEFDHSIGRQIGDELVAAHFTNAEAISKTLVLIVGQLPDLLRPAPPGVDVAARVAQLAGQLAACYASALRERSLDEQDAIYRAGLRARRQAEQALASSEARFRQVFYSSPVGVAISEPGGLIIQTNRSLEDILGYRPGELVDHDLSELFEPTEWHPLAKQYRGLVAGRASRLRVRFALRRQDGEAVWAHLDASVLDDGEGRAQHVVTMVDDITDLHLLEQRLHHQTLHDLQTGLPNRQYFLTHLEQVLGRLGPSEVLTLMHLDLDGFTAINGGLGHQTGDQLLDVVARRLEGSLTDQQAMVARLGADEYAILLEPSEKGAAGTNSALEVNALVETINTELAEPFYTQGVGIALTATIGVVQRRAGQSSAGELMRAAGATLRRVRGRGTRQWALYDPELDATDRTALRLAATMPGAVETGQLRVAYQPVSILEDHRLAGVEATLAWSHPQLGMLDHDQCVLAAERIGLIHELGQWLLRTAAEQTASWRRHASATVPPMMVNLAYAQAQDPDLVARVRAILNDTGLKPPELELRAPVTAIRTVSGELAGEGGTQGEDNLGVLTELGLRTGLHDFAGGIGALRCLAEVPVHTVRIAQTISEHVGTEPSRADPVLVPTLRAAGVDVIAFPIESTEQAACWAGIGANWAAGTLFGPPGPPGQIEILFR